MDSLLQIIKKLKKEEIRNFKIFTNRFERREEVKIAKLFDLYRENADGNESTMVQKLFPEDSANMNAFYRLKNRLKTELEKSLLNLHHDLDERISTINLITLSSIFSYKAQYEVALHYLKKAERTAKQNEFYDLLDLIYSEIINISENYNEINPTEYINKREENAQKILVLTQANNAIASISYKLRKTPFGHENGDVNSILQGILNELHIANDVYKMPTVKFKIHFVIRDMFLQSREFSQLENYLINSYNEFEKDGLFSKNTHHYKIGLIAWVINTLIVNKKWDLSLQYSELLHKELHQYGKLYYENYIWTYYQSLITNYMSSGRLDEAIKLLENMLKDDALKGKMVYDYSVYGNLALCYYFNHAAGQAIKILSQFLTKDNYGKLSQQFQFSFSLLEIILHYENHSLDYAGYKIMEFKRQFRTLLNQTGYAEEKAFLKILYAMCNRAEPLKDKSVMRQIKNFTEGSSVVQVGSGRYIDYNLWLKSKVERKWYYDSFLQSLQASA